MFGWEFPPFSSGGLGTACLGLTKGLSSLGAQVTFVVPKAPAHLRANHDHISLAVAAEVEQHQHVVERMQKDGVVSFAEVETILSPYMSEEQYQTRYHDLVRRKLSLSNTSAAQEEESVYGKNLYEEVKRYATRAKYVAQLHDHDVIHAHDWMAYQAGLAAKHATGKPLVCHIHATEFDRTGGNVDQAVYNIEREGLHGADLVLAVSELTKNTVVQHYGVDENKVRVCHNAVEFTKPISAEEAIKDTTDNMVLFLGRITIQKGPEYFVRAAQMVLEKRPNTTFVVAGSGDMEDRMVGLAHELGIAHKMLFTGFLRGSDIDRAYKMADLYVMPSVSEPFGITPLEAMRNGTPVLISKTSGVSEVIKHALKVDFWDVRLMASKICGILDHSNAHDSLAKQGAKEVTKFDWKEPAAKCMVAYNDVLKGGYLG